MAAGILFVLFFSYINAAVWGDGGYIVHIFGAPSPAYSLVWIWIALISLIYCFNYLADGKSKSPVCHIISLWWTANIATTSILNSIHYRGIEESGGLIFGYPVLIMDFLAMGVVDLLSLLVVWFFVARKGLGVSVWLLVFCGYLVANLVGHSAGSYALMTGVSIDAIGQSYDAFMYSVFTAMLVFQAFGGGYGVALKWIGSNVDIHRDIRADLRLFADRYFHLHRHS